MNNWISIKEKLPEHGTLVLVSWKCSTNERSVSTGYLSTHRGWVDLNSIRIEKLITHWMSLPEPPKEQNIMNALDWEDKFKEQFLDGNHKFVQSELKNIPMFIAQVFNSGYFAGVKDLEQKIEQAISVS